MTERVRYLPDNLKSDTFPEVECGDVRLNHEVELDGMKTYPARLFDRMLSHHFSDSLAFCLGQNHVRAIANVVAEARLIRPQPVRTYYFTILFRHINMLFRRKPIFEHLFFRRIRSVYIRIAPGDHGLDDLPNCGPVGIGCFADRRHKTNIRPGADLPKHDRGFW